MVQSVLETRLSGTAQLHPPATVSVMVTQFQLVSGMSKTVVTGMKNAE